MFTCQEAGFCQERPKPDEPMTVTYRRLAKDPVGVMYTNIFFEATFSADFGLKMFPFDTQCLPVKVHLWGGGVKTSPDAGRWLVHNDDIFAASYPKWVEGYDAMTPPRRKHTERALYHDAVSKTEGAPGEKQWLVIACVAQRRSAYYVKEIMCTLFALSSLGFITFALDSFSDQTSFRVTLLLTIVAYKLVIADKLPKLPYTTALDVYMNLCFSLIFILQLCYVVMELVSRSDVEYEKDWVWASAAVVWVVI